jgi:hypothetical protein
MASMNAIKVADRDPAASVLVNVLKTALDVHRGPSGDLKNEFGDLPHSFRKSVGHDPSTLKSGLMGGSHSPLEGPFEICV